MWSCWKTRKMWTTKWCRYCKIHMWAIQQSTSSSLLPDKLDDDMTRSLSLFYKKRHMHSLAYSQPAMLMELVRNHSKYCLFFRTDQQQTVGISIPNIMHKKHKKYHNFNQWPFLQHQYTCFPCSFAVYLIPNMPGYDTDDIPFWFFSSFGITWTAWRLKNLPICSA